MTDIQIIMMGFFVVLFVVSIMKLRSFLFSTLPKDSDITPQAVHILNHHIKRAIIECHNESRVDVSTKNIYEHVVGHSDFDTTYFWRFNQNRCNTLIKMMHVKYETDSLKALYEKLIKEGI